MQRISTSLVLILVCLLTASIHTNLSAAEEQNKKPDYLVEGMKKGLWKEVKEAPATPEIKNNKEVFRVKLKNFGIKSGLPEKKEEVIDGNKVLCYSDADYQQAIANVKGINAAIAKGAESGAKWIVFPKEEIAICYSSRPEEKILINSDNVIVDFGGSTFKVLYDSGKRSPFHMDYDFGSKTYTPSKNPAYTFCGTAVTVSDCSNTTVRNLKLIGDKIDRSFKIQAEKAVEGTYGVAAGGNCDNIVVEKIDTAFFMGDGLTCSGSQKRKQIRVGYQMNWQEGNISGKGQETPEKGYFRSDFLKVNPNSSFYMQGYGYTQGMTALRKRAYHVYLYDEAKNFTGYAGFIPALRYFSSKADTAYIRIVVEEPEKNGDGWQMALYEGKYGENITFRDNYIHHNHRGGMTIGVNDMYITRNKFYNNGVAPDTENGLPGFEQPNGNYFMTRYHINMEDSQGHNIRIINNRFEGGRLGIAVRGSDFIIEGNEFIRTGMTFYRLHHLICRNNTIREGMIDTFPYGKGGGFVRNWYIHSNDIKGSIHITGDAPISSISDNTIHGGFYSDGEVQIFKNNTLHMNQDAGYTLAIQLKNIKRMESCKVTKSPDCKNRNTLYLQCEDVDNCTFERIKMEVGKSILRNSTLENCSLAFKDSLKLENCTMIRSDYTVLNNYEHHPYNSAFFIVPKQDGELVLDRCKIKMLDTKVPFFSNWQYAATASSLILKDTVVEPSGVLNTGLFGTMNGKPTKAAKAE